MALVTNRKPGNGLALSALIAVLGLVLGACDFGTADSTTTTAAPVTTTTTSAPTTTTTLPPEPFVYRVGLSEPPTTNNYWAYFDPQSSLVDQYIREPTKPSLFTYDHPGVDLAADLALDDLPPEPVEDGATWTVTVPLKPDARWSDGVPITADDIVFTFETARDLELRRGWATAYPDASSDSLGLEAIEAVAPDTVLLRFNGRPGLPFWPNGPGTAPIMPKHFWEPILVEALTTDDPVTALLTADATGEPSGGPLVITSFSRQTVEALPNEHYQRSGTEIESGGATYEIGPFFDEMVFRVYPGPVPAVEALDAGEIDVVLSTAGIDRQSAAFLASNAAIETVTNDTNGFRYLAFNLRNQPMSLTAFRDAIALMIDKEFLVDEVLGGQAKPLYSTVSPADPRWYDAAIAEGFASRYRDATTEERLIEAVGLLEAAGFTWEQRPAFIDNAVVAGTGLLFEGQPVDPIRIFGPGPAFDPFRSTYTLWVEEWVSQLGFETAVTLMPFAALVTHAFTPTPAGDLDFDIYILGWRLPSPAIPVYHESFWASGNETISTDGNNNTGFANDQFDSLVDRYNRAETSEEAFTLLWEMEQILFTEKPYVVLYDAPVIEAFRSDTVVFPFTNVLSGLQFLHGMPGLVRPAP